MPPPQSSRSSPRGQSSKRLLNNGHHQAPERSASFHGRAATSAFVMRRPKTQPDLLAAGTAGSRRIVTGADEGKRVPAKVLVNVNVQRSLGAVQVMASTEWTVEHLVEAAVRQYVKEGRRPLLSSADASAFSLHYSQFSFECLDLKEKLINLGSRNFFLCPKTVSSAAAAGGANTQASSTSISSSCSKEAEKGSKIAIPWLKFMEFMF